MARTRTRRTQAERSAETRRLLLEAAVKSLYEHGYGATTTMSVAERAGVSRGAMLHQFRTKADLMLFVVESVYEEEVELYQEMFQGITDPHERLMTYPLASWTILSRPSGVAVLEIMLGSRSDKVLAKQLRPLQARIEASARMKIAGEVGGPASIEALRLVAWSARGLSIAKVLALDPSRIEDTVHLLQTLLSLALKAGLVSISPQGESAQPKQKGRRGSQAAAPSGKP